MPDHPATHDDPAAAPPPRTLIGAAVAASLFLLLVVAWTLLRSDGAEQPSAAAAADGAGSEPEVQAGAPQIDSGPEAGGDTPVPTIPVIVVPGPVDSEVDVDGEPPVDAPSPVPQPPPTGPGAPDPAPPALPASAPELGAQESYELDPGVLGVSITLQNQGDAPLEYELLNDGDGYAADAPVGEIAPDALAAIWLDLDVSPDGDGPTPFTQIVEVDSNGGDTEITIAGQLEKPGFLVVEADSVPVVDFRATVGFTNVGGLPLQITDVSAPGLTLSPIPDAIAAGETLSIDVALCDGDALPPGSFSYPHPTQPGLFIHQLNAHVHLTTDVNAEVITLSGTVVQLDRPSCEPVVDVPDLDVVLDG